MHHVGLSCQAGIEMEAVTTQMSDTRTQRYSF